MFALIRSAVAPYLALPLRFYPVLASVAISSFGDGMRMITFPLLAAHLTTDARQVTLILLAGQLPWIILGLTSGAVADRVDRQRILWVVDSLRAGVMGALAYLAATHTLTIPLLAAGSFLIGCGQVFFNGAWVGVIPALVSPGQLPGANARVQAGSLVVGSVMGTPIGAVLFGLAAALPLEVDAGSFALAALCVLLLPARILASRTKEEEAPITQGALQGLRLLRQNRLLRDVCVMSGATNLVMVGLMAVLVLYARQVLGFGAKGFALLVVAFALGGVAGARTAPRLARRFGRVRVLRLGPPVSGALAVAVGSASSGWLAVPLIAGYGATFLIWDVNAITLRQSVVPKALLGRVNMVYEIAVVGVAALGAPLAGLLFQAVGPRMPFFAAAALLLLCALVIHPPDPSPVTVSLVPQRWLPQPPAGKHRRKDDPPPHPVIAAILMAAGPSRGQHRRPGPR